jgi:hypothetical protein
MLRFQVCLQEVQATGGKHHRSSVGRSRGDAPAGGQVTGRQPVDTGQEDLFASDYETTFFERTNEITAARDVVVTYLVRTTSGLPPRGWLASMPGLMGFAPCIVMNALNNYVSLHLHLLSRRILGCLELHPAGDHHVGVDQRSRSLPNKDPGLCAVAIYLRDGAANSWASAALQRRRTWSCTANAPPGAARARPSAASVSRFCTTVTNCP